MKRKHEEVSNSKRNRLLARLRANDGRCAFIDASDEMKADREVALAAVSLEGYLLYYASPELQDDKVIVMTAVSEKGYALEYASRRLQNDKEIVMAAVNKWGTALEFASTELRADRDVVLAAIDNDRSAIKHASDDLKADEAVVTPAIRRYPSLFSYAASTLRADYAFVARVITMVGSRSKNVLKHVSQEIKSDLRDTVSKFNTFTEARDFLRSHAAFLEFLCCVRSKSAAVAGKPVTMLYLDTETSEKLHRHIAEYAGVPLGQELEPVHLLKRVMPILDAYFEYAWDDALRQLLRYI